MNVSVHFVASLILAVLLYPFYGILSLIVLIGGFLIDTDHWLWYVYVKKDLSIANSYRYYVSREYRKDRPMVIHIFHTIEFWALCFFASLYLTPAFILTLGVFSHIFLDFIYSWQHDPRKERPTSIILYFLKLERG
jgi:hypothetical protein